VRHLAAEEGQPQPIQRVRPCPKPSHVHEGRPREGLLPSSSFLLRAAFSMISGAHESSLRNFLCYGRDCKYECRSASKAVGLLVWSITSKDSMKPNSSDDTFGPGNFSSSWRKVPTVMNCVSTLVSGCSKVDPSSSATRNSSSYSALLTGGSSGPIKRRIFAMHHASVSPWTILSFAPKMADEANQCASFLD
jgi:hypothetical protein